MRDKVRKSMVGKKYQEKEQQKKMEDMNVSEPGKYPEAEGDTNKDVPPGT